MRLSFSCVGLLRGVGDAAPYAWVIGGAVRDRAAACGHASLRSSIGGRFVGACGLDGPHDRR